MAKIKSNRKALVVKFNKKRDEALKVVGAQAVGFIKPLVTVDSGFLRSSITYATFDTAPKPTREAGAGSVTRKGKKVPGKFAGKTITATLNDVVEQPNRRGVVSIGTNVKYAAHIEYGTQRGSSGFFTPGIPFLRPGVLNNKQTLAKLYAKMMKGI